ncbi:hypothetical protein NPIL_17111 [Nephila pilipes]|uniref:Uncharacterized protein n=1 Tax=Nephila pilipes TaxID=299642 RepID=A0A8X6NPR5_NEPPI|nr:hypothetical protein NPIL_17111 [Nephila pilipes]
MPKILPDDVTSEFTNKLTILNALSKEMRPNDLLKVLLMYVDSELRLGIQGECVLTVFKEKTSYCNNVKQFLDECMKVTLTNVQAMIEETMQ